MKKFLSLVLALVMAMSLVTLASAKDFTDDGSITYKEAVDVISELDVVDGYSDGSFRPKGTLTRGAAAKIISNLILGPTDADALPTNVSPFKDVPAGSTFAGYIAFCSSEGIISGYSDGTFKPAGTLSGYAFMKMLLGALGYNQYTENYVGANWKVNVAKRAMNVGLDDDLESAFNGSRALTREEACLYALNTLKADMVEYENQATISVGDLTVQSNSKAKEVEDKNNRNGTIYRDEVLQFAEKYFKDLKLTKPSDDFGRPSNKWAIKSKEVGTYSTSADASYAKDVKAEDVYADLSLSDDQDFVVYVDGKKLDKKINIDDVDKKLSKLYSDADFGNGIIVEFYFDDSGDDTDARMVVINPIFGEVDRIKNDGRTNRKIVIDGKEFETQSFEEDDKVIYTVAKGDIQDVMLAERQTGTITRTVGDDLYIDGTKYELSVSDGADNSTVKAKDDVKYYLDANGYIISIEADDSTNVDNLAFVDAASSDRTDYAKLIFADATKRTVDTDDNYRSLVGKIVSYKEDKGEYELKDKTTLSDENITVDYTKGNATFATVDGTKVKVNSNTVFVYNELDSTGKSDSIKAYTGFKNAPSIEGTLARIAVRCEDNKTSKAAVLVYVEIESGASVGSSNDLTFIAVKSKPKAIDDGDLDVYYELPAIVDGRITTLMVKDDVTEVEAIYSDGGIVIYKDYTTNSDDQVRRGTEATEGADKDYLTATTVGKVKNDVITLDGTGYGYTDDVKVFFINSDLDEITSRSITSIRDNDSATDRYSKVYFTLDDDDIDMIVVVEAE